MDKNLRDYMAELLGTFALVFVGASTVCASMNQQQPQVGIALAQGFMLAAGLAATLSLSGGYLNPAVTITLWACKRLDGAKTTMLLFVQLLGAALAGAAVRWLTFGELVLGDARLGTPHLNPQVFELPPFSFVTRLKGIGAEAVLTFILTFIIFATTIDPRAPRLLGRAGKWLSGLWIGLALAAVTVAGFHLTGAAANPARWFGTVIWEMSVPSLQFRGPFSDFPVYTIGPVLGAILAGGAYTLLILPPEEAHVATTGTANVASKVAAGSTLFRAKK